MLRLTHASPTIPILGGFANGLAALTDLGQTVSRAEETLDIDRAYREIPALQNLTLAETLASRWRSLPERESLETFQEFNRRKLQANAHKLLGEIYTAKNDSAAAMRWRSLPEWESVRVHRLHDDVRSQLRILGLSHLQLSKPLDNPQLDSDSSQHSYLLAL